MLGLRALRVRSAGMAAKRRGRAAKRGGRACSAELRVRVPEVVRERLGFVRLLDGRPVAEWARAVLLAELSRLLVERPGFAWARPGAPAWRDPGGELSAGAAPVSCLEGGERVLVLAVLGEVLPAALDPEGDGLALLVDVVPEGAPILRRVVVRAVDVLPWRRRPGEPVAAGSPGAARADRRARLQEDRRRARDARSRASSSGGGADGPAEPDSI